MTITLRLVRLAATLLAAFACVAGDEARAGDAIAIGYNRDGVWTAVTYYSSGTAKGGADYKDEAAAREAALRDLKQRASEDLVTSKVLASSDRTGHVAYARGKAARQDIHGIGYGASKEAAEKEAFADLRRQGATRELKVIYNYFSHGADNSAVDAKPKPKARPRRS